MSWLTELRTLLRESLLPPLALHSFTCLMGVKPEQHERLEQLLAELDGGGTDRYAQVPGLHNLRWIVLAPTEGAEPDPQAPKALVLSVMFDGELEDILEELDGRLGTELHAVLQRCEGYFEEGAQPLAFLRRRELPCGYLFRDLGPIAPGSASARVADATIREIRAAQQLTNEFAEFYAKNPPAAHGSAPQKLLQRFRAKFDGVSLAQRRLHPLEKRLPEEERWIRLASELMIRRQTRVQRNMHDGVVRRSAHAKGHGFVTATFKVCKSKYAIGLFGTPGQEFEATLRPSNAAQTVTRDRKFDARGLAIALDLSGQGKPGDWLGEEGRQDFLLFNDPNFVAGDVEQYVRLLAVLGIRDRRRMAWYGLRFLAGPGALKQVWVALRCSLVRPRHPLRLAWHSSTAFQLGGAHVAKYSAEVANPQAIVTSADESSDDFLSVALERSLAQGLRLNFYVHVLPTTGPSALSKEALTRAVEDTSLDWAKLGAEKVLVATIEVGAQASSAAQRLALGEVSAFNPWNAHRAHRPLGSLNRARRLAYKEGRAFRSADTAVPAQSPAPAQPAAAPKPAAPHDEAPPKVPAAAE